METFEYGFSSDELPVEVRMEIEQMYQTEGKILTIRYLRGVYEGMGLKEAKALVESVIAHKIACDLLIGTYFVCPKDDGYILIRK
jgi:hypothetical protein